MGLNVLDWASGNFGNHLSASNKGSYGTRVKILVVSSTTVKLLRRYFDDDIAGRHKADALSLRISDATRIHRVNPKELDGLPLFLNQRGRRMSTTLFRDFYWKPALAAAGVDADPHQARHQACLAPLGLAPSSRYGIPFLPTASAAFRCHPASSVSGVESASKRNRFASCAPSD